MSLKALVQQKNLIWSIPIPYLLLIFFHLLCNNDYLKISGWLLGIAAIIIIYMMVLSTQVVKQIVHRMFNTKEYTFTTEMFDWAKIILLGINICAVWSLFLFQFVIYVALI